MPEDQRNLVISIGPDVGCRFLEDDGDSYRALERPVLTAPNLTITQHTSWSDFFDPRFWNPIILEVPTVPNVMKYSDETWKHGNDVLVEYLNPETGNFMRAIVLGLTSILLAGDQFTTLRIFMELYNGDEI